ncbi:MAG: choice-of-anchor D domain-containing protein [Acidobacteriota bacterium]
MYLLSAFRLKTILLIVIALTVLGVSQAQATQLVLRQGSERVYPGDEIDFGDIDPGEQRSLSFKLKNNGPGDMVLPDSVRLEGSEFTIPNTPTVVPQGQSRWFAIKTTGTGLGIATRTVTLHFEGGPAEPFEFRVRRKVRNRIKVKHQGQQIGYDEVIDFGRIEPGELKALSFALRNRGSDTIRLGNGLTLAGGAFELPQSPPSEVPPGEAGWFALRTTGSGFGLATETVTIDYADDAAVPFRFRIRRVIGPLVLHNAWLEDGAPFAGELPVDARDWQVMAWNGATSTEVLQGSFREIGGTRLLIDSHSFTAADEREMHLRWHRVIGTLTEAQGGASVVAGVLAEWQVEGAGSIWFLESIETHRDLDLLIAETGRLFQAAESLPSFLAGSMDGMLGGPQKTSGLPPAFLEDGCDDPTALDSCGATFCDRSAQVVEDFFFFLSRNCAVSIAGVLASCPCALAPDPTLSCMVGCFSSIDSTLMGCTPISPSEAIGQLNQIKDEAECCYCDNFLQYNNLCGSCEGQPIRAQVEGLSAGETVDVTATCLGGPVQHQNTVTFDGSAPVEIQEIVVCSEGSSFEVMASKVETPGIVDSRDRECSPTSGYHRTLTPGGEGFTASFECSCSNAVNCPRTRLTGTVSGLTPGQQIRVIANVSSETFPDFFASRTLSTNGSFAFHPSVPRGSVVTFVQETTGADCTVEGKNLGTPLVGPAGSSVEIAEVECNGVPDPCPMRASGQSIGFTAAFRRLQGATGTEDFVAKLESCEGEQLVEVSGPGSYTFPEPVSRGVTYRVSAVASSAGTICSVANGSGTVKDQDIDDIEVFCLLPGRDACLVSPQLCREERPGPTCELQGFRFEEATVFSTGSAGEVIGSHTTIYLIYEVYCSVGRSQGPSTYHQGPIVYLRTNLQDSVAGDLVIRGVARDDRNGIAGVETYIDGQRVQLEGFATHQPDAWTCAEVPGARCDGDSAFSGRLDPADLGLAPGMHTLLVRAINGNGTPLEGIAEMTFEVANPVDDAQILSLSFSDQIGCGETATASLTLENTGTTTWSRDEGIQLGAVGNSDPFTETIRHRLPAGVTVAPGESHTFIWPIMAPPIAGTSLSDWQLLRSGVAWFGTRLNRNVTVSCNPPVLRLEGDGGAVIPDGGSVDFGPVTVGSASTSKTFTVCNDGPSPSTLLLDQVSIKGLVAAFYLDQAPSATVAAGSCTDLTVRFAPDQVGTAVSSLVIKDYDSNLRSHAVTLTGTGL